MKTLTNYTSRPPNATCQLSFVSPEETLAEATSSRLRLLLNHEVQKFPSPNIDDPDILSSSKIIIIVFGEGGRRPGRAFLNPLYLGISTPAPPPPRTRYHPRRGPPQPLTAATRRAGWGHVYKPLSVIRIVVLFIHELYTCACGTLQADFRRFFF